MVAKRRSDERDSQRTSSPSPSGSPKKKRVKTKPSANDHPASPSDAEDDAALPKENLPINDHIAADAQSPGGDSPSEVVAISPPVPSIANRGEASPPDTCAVDSPVHKKTSKRTSKSGKKKHKRKSSKTRKESDKKEKRKKRSAHSSRKRKRRKSAESSNIDDDVAFDELQPGENSKEHLS